MVQIVSRTARRDQNARSTKDARRLVAIAKTLSSHRRLSGLGPQVEEFRAEQHAGFRKGRTVGQIFHLRILIEKFRGLGREIYHDFVDFNKSFDRVWHATLCHHEEYARTSSEWSNRCIIMQPAKTHVRKELVNGTVEDICYHTVYSIYS